MASRGPARLTGSSALPPTNPCAASCPTPTSPAVPPCCNHYRLCYAATGWAENSVYPGVPAVLQRLQDAGWQLFVCTSKREDFALQVLEKFSLRSYFLAVYAVRSERFITARRPCSVVSWKSSLSTLSLRPWWATATSISKPPARTA